MWVLYLIDEVTKLLVVLLDCDLDYTSDLDHKRSLKGYIFILRNDAISWHAKLQLTIVVSMNRGIIYN